jgi:hypothetical protein
VGIAILFQTSEPTEVIYFSFFQDPESRGFKSKVLKKA